MGSRRPKLIQPGCFEGPAAAWAPRRDISPSPTFRFCFHRDRRNPLPFITKSPLFLDSVAFPMLACPREGLVSAFCSCPPNFASDFLRPHPRGCRFVFGYLVPPNWPIGDFHSRPCIMSCVQTKPAAFLPRASFSGSG